MKIILASASPRRQELLKNIFEKFDILTSSCEESAVFETPSGYVMDLAHCKAADVAKRFDTSDCIQEDVLIIGADTIVYHEGVILGKPADKAAACDMLRHLSGKSHEVYTGVSLVQIKNGRQSFHDFYACTHVKVAPLSDEEILAYANSSEPYDKAGSYGIQGCFSRHITGIDGDYFNVVGLPVNRLYEELKLLQLV